MGSNGKNNAESRENNENCGRDATSGRVSQAGPGALAATQKNPPMNRGGRQRAQIRD
jgi:hypothetical protein